MVFSNWGNSVGSETITSFPLWLKLSNLPDCYWTQEGLSRVASVVGVADALTSQLEILPFAKMCVDCKVGDPLPNVITVVDMDPITGCKFNVEVKVTYLNKPLICSHCKSLGHIVNVCPAVKRV